MSETLTLQEFVKRARTGKTFSCAFIKRGTGEVRKMVCRTGVKAHLRGGSLPYNAASRNLLTVWDFTVAGYRQINLDWMIWAKVTGRLWMWNHEKQVFIEADK